ncbi:MAG TPA: PadR family transcriptional regulator [Thermoleophilaceae bacterium]|jgi:DNA-binding PadR family transcriptional regulator|nr:PadR family transcriptional regulator [Thermoleophilaceae bacterium]
MHFHGDWGGGPRGGWQRGPWGGFGPWGPPFGGRGGGPRVRRGNVRAAVLALLSERPMHGYEMIQELEARTNGVWRPSAGSIYPTLQQLEDEGLVTVEESEGKRRFTLTDAGRTEAEGLGRPPWEEVTDLGDGPAASLRDSAFQLGAAVVQVARTGSEDQIAKTREILSDARRRVYAVLGEGGEA